MFGYLPGVFSRFLCFQRFYTLSSLNIVSRCNVVMLLVFPLKTINKLMTEWMNYERSHVDVYVYTCRFSSRACTLLDWLSNFLFCSLMSFSCGFKNAVFQSLILLFLSDSLSLLVNIQVLCHTALRWSKSQTVFITTLPQGMTIWHLIGYFFSCRRKL